jgi:hypothetical protein
MAKQTMLFRGTNLIKLAVVKVLREAFANPNIVLDERYRYVASLDEDRPTKKETKIAIYRNYPERIEVYPCIIVSAGGYNADLMSMGEERELGTERKEDGILVSESFVGYSSIPITLTVFAKSSTDDRENLTDILVMILRVLGRGLFAKWGFGWNKISVAGESEATADDGEIIYQNSVTINCNTDFWYKLAPEQIDLINSIGIKVFGQLNPDAPLVPLHPID